MLERLSNKSQPAIFQLYPKPFPKPNAPRPKIRPEWVKGRKQSTQTANTGIPTINSIGALWTTTGRSKDGNAVVDGKRLSDYHRSQEMPQSILRDFERAVEIHCAVKSSLESIKIYMGRDLCINKLLRIKTCYAKTRFQQTQ